MTLDKPSDYIFKKLSFAEESSIKTWTIAADKNILVGWSSDGTGNGLPYWSKDPLITDGEGPNMISPSITNPPYKERKAIASSSQRGALLFGSKSEHYAQRDRASASIISPVIDCENQSTIFLKFNNYYRNFASKTYVEVLSESGNPIHAFQVNKNIQRNVETGRDDYISLDISQYANNRKIRLRFRAEGILYFWLIDDIELWDRKPFEMTFPETSGVSLRSLGIDYRTDLLKGAYQISEKGYPLVVVNFKQNTSTEVRKQLSIKYGAIKVKDCVCNKVELWALTNNVPRGGEEPSAYGNTTSISERVANGNVETPVTGMGHNHYLRGDYNVQAKNQPLGTIPSIGISDPKLKIAVLDTGVDYMHNELKDYIVNAPIESINRLDEDKSCYPDDPIGWNFIDDNNNPFDDMKDGHGTHIAGIIVDNISKVYQGEFGILPVKTHDYKGVGTIFTGICGIYYALKKKAQIINGSWGYFGEKNLALKSALEEAKRANVLFIASSGNLDTNSSRRPKPHLFYPAAFDLANIIAVTALDHKTAPPTLPNFSNYSNVFVDVGAPGDEIISLLPKNGEGKKSGTSMAAPFVTASCAEFFLQGFVGNEIVHKVLDNSTSYKTLSPFIREGKALNIKLGATIFGLA